MDQYKKLKEHIKTYGKMCVAFSGGADSSLLLKAAVDALGSENVLAIMADTTLGSKNEPEEAERAAQAMNAPFIIVKADPLICPEVKENRRDRCYHCKKMLFSAIIKAAKENGFFTVADGTNEDDINAYRPGLRAIAELSVVSPLRDCGFHKTDVRACAKTLGLAEHNKPSKPCLATRVPYDTTLTAEMLSQIERGEEVLAKAGLMHFRLRHHGNLARIEADRQEREIVLSHPEITEQIKRLGFQFVVLDLEDLRSGCYD